VLPDSFNALHRIIIKPLDIPWKIMHNLLKASEELYLALVEAKLKKPQINVAEQSHRKVKLLDSW